MEELSYTQESDRLFIPTADNKGDDSLQVRFYKMSDGEKDIDWCEIKIPGNSYTVNVEPVTDYHRQRFHKKWLEYSLFKEANGTPIENWTAIPESMRKEFLRQDFQFIEQVAAAPESSFQKFMGGPSWRLKAQAFLDRNKVSNDDIIKSQAQQIAELQGFRRDSVEKDNPKRAKYKTDIEEGYFKTQ
jgi:hypothetical protein